MMICSSKSSHAEQTMCNLNVVCFVLTHTLVLNDFGTAIVGCMDSLWLWK
jgi:hypothetical protein